MTNSVQVYTQGTGTSSTEAFIPFFSDINPSTSDINFPVGKRWINYVSKVEFILKNTYSDNGVVLANWIEFSSGVSSTETLSGNSGGPVAVDSNNNIAVEGDATSINIVGNPSTHTLTANVILPATANAVLYSEVSSIGGVAPGTAGQILTCQGPSSPPTWEDASAGATQTLTPDVGGAVSPVANNIDVTSFVYGTSASKGIKTFNGGAGILQISNLLGVTPYVVGADSTLYHYNTIQSAINAANSDAPSAANPKIVYITAGTYTENLFLQEYIYLVGLSSGYSNEVTIDGTVTCSLGNGTHVLENLNLTSSGVTISFSASDPTIKKYLLQNCHISSTAGNTAAIFMSGDNSTYDFNNCVIEQSSPTASATSLTSGTLNVYQSIIYNNEQTENYIGGTASFYNCILNTWFTNQGCNLSIYSCVCNAGSNPFILSAASNNTIFNSVINSSADTEFFFDDLTSSTLSYGNIQAIGSAKKINNTTTITQQTLLNSNLSFDGGYTKNNIDGGLWIGSTAGVPVATTLTAGSGINITNAANSITISSSGGGFTWQTQSTNFTAVANHGYLIDASATATLPTSPNEGDTISFISSLETGGITVLSAGSTSISVSNVNGAVGGSAISSAYGDSLTLTYISSASKWFGTSMIGSWTIS